MARAVLRRPGRRVAQGLRTVAVSDLGQPAPYAGVSGIKTETQALVEPARRPVSLQRPDHPFAWRGGEGIRNQPTTDASTLGIGQYVQRVQLMLGRVPDVTIRRAAVGIPNDLAVPVGHDHALPSGSGCARPVV